MGNSRNLRLEAQVVELYAKCSAQVVAEKLDISQTGVLRILRRHGVRSRTLSQAQRLGKGDKVANFWKYVEKLESGCWQWTGGKDHLGYGSFKGFARYPGKAYRFSYELHKGPIPKGLTIDHLCRNPSCVNPDHLEAVTNRVNQLRGFSPAAMNARKTHCKYGHPLSGDNLVLVSGKYDRPARQCRTCLRAHSRKAYRRRREELPIERRQAPRD